VDVRGDALNLRARVRELLATSRSSTTVLAVIASRVGATNVAAKLRQLSTDLVAVDVPSAATTGRRVTVRLLGRVGTDQIATALRDGGWDGFEPPMPTVFAACAAAFPGVIYDVGANTGLYSVIAARVNKANRIYAFEPFPPVRAHLKSTLRVNHCGRSIAVEPLAVGSANGTASLYVPLQDHGLVETSASLSSSFKDEYSDVIEVTVVSVDNFTSDRRPGHVTLMKIDVESLEAEVLKGAVTLLTTDRPLVFCEVLPKGDAPAIENLRRTHRYIDIQLHPAHAAVGGSVGFDNESWNHLLVPEEKRDRVAQLLTDCGLEVRNVDSYASP
jgi:FkbM family methyltransferase